MRARGMQVLTGKCSRVTRPAIHGAGHVSTCSRRMPTLQMLMEGTLAWSPPSNLSQTNALTTSMLLTNDQTPGKQLVTIAFQSKGLPHRGTSTSLLDPLCDSSLSKFRPPQRSYAQRVAEPWQQRAECEADATYRSKDARQRANAPHAVVGQSVPTHFCPKAKQSMAREAEKST